MYKFITRLFGILALSVPTIVCATTIAQNPLYLVISANPNVLFNMSIETPMGGAAYNDQPGTLAGGNVCGGRDGGYGICYFKNETYLGYFDPKKCYSYTTSSGGYFYPNGAANADHECSGKFSGNMMNWASMTAMDMFVYTLTGGNRVIDNTGSNAVTVVKRARRQNNNSWYPNKRLNSGKNVSTSSVTPWGWTNVYIFNIGKDQNGSNNPSTEQILFCNNTGCTKSNKRKYYNLHVRVCDKTQGLEANCTSYSNGNFYKPEGLVQSKADHMRFAVTSYTKDGDRSRDGGVLRANMKYVGPTMPDGTGGTQTNPKAEITSNGTYVADPDNLAGSGGVNHSGVINYINRFSEYGYKGIDPASELFYESIRYYKNLGPTPEYSSGLTNSEKGGFPVINGNDWEDPIQYSCQKNFIIGINDANPWLDKRLPGTHFTAYNTNGGSLSNGDYGEPSNPDTDINVTTLTNKVGELEGLNGTTQCIGCVAGNCNFSSNNKYMAKLGEAAGTCPYSPKQNSYYIAGLAYYANTQDIRTDSGMDGEQNIATFMIDSQEYSTNPLTGQMNMLWLAGKYGGFIDSNGNDEPDLQSEWDADGDGEPDNYVLATRPDLMIASLAKSFDEIEKRTSSASSIATNSTRLDTDSKIYQATFSSGTWGGNLLAFNLNPTTGAVGTQAWNAADLIPQHSSRDIFSSSASVRSGIEFKYTNLNATQKTQITADQLEYIRGDQSNEGGATFRTRSKILGDIINSDPVYTGSESFNYYQLEMSGTDSTYAAYLAGTGPSGTASNDKYGRPEVIYVGANDGMLHAILAEDVISSNSPCSPSGADCGGEEIFAYIPKALVSELPELTKIAYSHQYYVDGTPKHGDAYIKFESAGSARWGTALVGVLGGGGKGIFALDISDPLNFTANDVLWDLDNSDLSDLGYTFSQPTIVKLANGDWGAVVGNGYNSANHEAVLYIINLETGAVIKKIQTGAFGSSSATNGLSTPVVIDTDGDKVADTVYAGDLQGNMWKFDISDSNTSKWGVAYSHKDKGNTILDPLFTACTDDPCTDPQPITSKPQVVSANSGGVIVLFGTGKFFEVGDNNDTSQDHTYYGIRDNGAAIAGRNNLVTQSIIYEGKPTGLSYDVRVTTKNSVDYTTKSGWYMDFSSSSYDGERIVANALVRSGRVIFPTLVPETSPCSYGGTSWLMEMDAQTGSRLNISPFDLNDDGVIDEKDFVDTDGDGTPDTPASGKKSTVGIIKTPGVISTGDNEKKYTSGSSGNIEVTTESSDDTLGRQSWRQLK